MKNGTTHYSPSVRVLQLQWFEIRHYFLVSFRTVVVAVLLHLMSSEWYHFLGNFMYNCFPRMYFLHMCIFKAQNEGKLQESMFFPLLSPFWTPFGGRIKKLPTFSDSVNSNY